MPVSQYTNSSVYKVWIFFIAFLQLTGCKKFVEPAEPLTQLTSAAVFNNDPSVTSAITAVYSRMSSSYGFAGGAPGSITELCGLSADELINYSSDQNQSDFYNNSLTSANGNISGLWSEPYQYIYTANAILEGISTSTGISDSVKKQLTGEASFIRAFCYFYLTNLWGDVPLYLTTDYQKNSLSARTPASLVYEQIVADLTVGQNMMSADYSFSGGEKVRPNKWTAAALLSRTYLYLHKWDSAEMISSAVINSGVYSLVPDLNSVFLANSDEAIWQLLPVISGINTQEGYNFILTSDPYNVALSDNVRTSFEAGDNRLTNWVSSFNDGTNTFYFPFKYKIQAGSTLTEYSMVFRLAEQYLIRAEARANQNDFSGAQADLNAIRTRAGLSNTTATDQSSILQAIEHERLAELFSEWGHRWLDLKRTGRSTAVLGPVKGAGWQPYDTLYPIPLKEIQSNNRITQNPGY